MDPQDGFEGVKSPTLGNTTAVVYPERDDEPMGETDAHVRVTIELVQALDDLYVDRLDAYVAADNFLYYVEGDPRACVSPDVYLVLGAPRGERRVYKLWEEGGRTPTLVIELTSESTRAHDLGRKKAIYERELHVPYYILFDPLSEWIRGGVLAFALEGGRYRELAPDPRTQRMALPALDLELAPRGGSLRLFRRGAAEPIPTRRELIEAAHERAEAEHERAEAEHERAEAEHERAEAERARADEVERELRALRAELERLRRDGQP